MADALIGSLPRGLSLNEREKIFASTPLSPTLSLLSSMPSVSLHSLFKEHHNVYMLIDSY